MRHAVPVLLLLFLALCGGAQNAFASTTALDLYVAKPHPQFRFTHLDHHRHAGYDNYFLYLWSQQWRFPSEADRTVWEHEVSITVPWSNRVVPNRTAVLIVNGGSNSGSPSTKVSEAIPALAMATNSIVIFVNQIPNQPLFFSDDTQRGRDHRLQPGQVPEHRRQGVADAVAHNQSRGTHHGCRTVVPA